MGVAAVKIRQNGDPHISHDLQQDFMGLPARTVISSMSPFRISGVHE